MSDPRQIDPQVLRQALLTQFETYVHTEDSVHPSHALKVIPRAIAEVKKLEGLIEAGSSFRSMYEHTTYYVFSSFEHAVRLHRDLEVEIEEHEVFPILRVWALACYLDAPLDYDEYDWKVINRMVSGFYDDLLSEGRLPYVMDSAVKKALEEWDLEN
jgi:hypothetical protein